MKAKSSFSSLNAVASAGKGAAQVLAFSAYAGVRILDALIDTVFAFSMLSSAIYSRLPHAPAIQPFTRAAPDVIGVGGPSAQIRGYVDAPVEIVEVEVHHPLLVVEVLAFFLLIGTDILREQGAVLTLDESAPVRLRIRECAVCRKQRTKLPALPPSAPFTACAACSGVIEPFTAAFICVMASNALCKEPNISAEPIVTLLKKHGCAGVPSIHAPADFVFYLPIAKPSNARVKIAAGTPVETIAPIALALNSIFTAAMTPQLLRNDKLRKVLRELQIDTLPDSISYKRPLVSLVCKYLDVSAKSDSEVGTTNLVFHEIDFEDTRPLRQPVRRLPYGEVREAVAKEIEKLTNAGIARVSTSH